MTLGNKIRRLRESLGLSQIEVANAIEVSKQTLYKYEHDIVTNIPSDKIEALARVLNTTPAVLMGWEEDQGDNKEVTDSEKTKKAIELYDRVMSLPPSYQSALLNLLDSLQTKP